MRGTCACSWTCACTTTVCTCVQIGVMLVSISGVHSHPYHVLCLCGTHLQPLGLGTHLGTWAWAVSRAAGVRMHVWPCLTGPCTHSLNCSQHTPLPSRLETECLSFFISTSPRYPTRNTSHRDRNL